LFQANPLKTFASQLFQNRCKGVSLNNLNDFDRIASDFWINSPRSTLDDFSNSSAPGKPDNPAQVDVAAKWSKDQDQRARLVQFRGRLVTLMFEFRHSSPTFFV
jgi:hypothetical protein